MKKKIRRIILWELKVSETATGMCFKCLRKPGTFLTIISFSLYIHFYDFLGTDFSGLL